MTNPTQPKAIPSPALLVFGKPTSPDLPQASWFRVEDQATVVAAAQTLKFFVLDIQTDAERALTLGVAEGVLKSSGRILVGSVAPEVYKRIEEYVAKASAAPVSKATSDGEAGTKPASEQNTNNGEKGAPTPSAAKPAPMAPDGKTEVIAAASPSNGKPMPGACARPLGRGARRFPRGRKILATQWRTKWVVAWRHYRHQRKRLHDPVAGRA